MSFRQVWYDAADGLRLHARDYDHDGPLLPVLCLPGLTRNARDFEDVAERLSAERRVICPDFRGRGASQYAGDPKSYRPDVEMADTLALLDHLGIERAVIIGTSRGGLVGMMMAAAAPHRVAGLLLNDIGPRLEKDGLLRIRSYLGRDMTAPGWAHAVARLKSGNPGIVGLSDSGWEAFARRLFREEGGSVIADYDPALAVVFPSAEAIGKGPVPELWQIYETAAPVAILRGENSDLLSAATVEEMVARHKDAEAVTVQARGHVPFLDEPEAWAAIERLLSRASRSQTLS